MLSSNFFCHFLNKLILGRMSCSCQMCDPLPQNLLLCLGQLLLYFACLSTRLYSVYTTFEGFSRHAQSFHCGIGSLPAIGCKTPQSPFNLLVECQCGSIGFGGYGEGCLTGDAINWWCVSLPGWYHYPVTDPTHSTTSRACSLIAR